MSAQLGVAWFDDPHVADAGWASVGGEPAQRINGINGLRSDVTWVTNIPYKDFRNLNLGATPHVRDSQYLRSGVDLIGKELGLLDDASALAEALSSIGAHATAEGERRFGVKPGDSGYRYNVALSPRVIPSFVRERPRGAMSADIEEACRQATQANQAMTGKRRPPGSTAHSFVFPRTAYARYLLTRPMPVGSEWSQLRFSSGEVVFGSVEGVAVKGTKSVLGRLEELSRDKAVLLRVNVLATDRFFRPFATFGAGAMGPRAWATLPEVVEMSRYAKLALLGGHLAPLGQLPEALIPDVEQEYSYSRGLFFENLWVALASPIDGSTPTALGAYLRAHDRVLCGRAAEAFARQSFTVGSFGTGRVTVYLRRGEEGEATRLALSLGLLPPLDLNRDGVVDVDA